MIERRKFAELGGADHGWLKAKHHFSFASYYDSERMGWGNLRVWNDDEIASKSGFLSSGEMRPSAAFRSGRQRRRRWRRTPKQ
jgi:redox-sensitive bicupin YhaK (pirin superfamily)